MALKSTINILIIFIIILVVINGIFFIIIQTNYESFSSVLHIFATLSTKPYNTFKFGNNATNSFVHTNSDEWAWNDFNQTSNFCLLPIFPSPFRFKERYPDIERFKRKYGQLLYPNNSKNNSGLWSQYNKVKFTKYNPKQKPVKYALGCSVSKYYCNGPPQPIPCCTTIAFEMWIELDKYFTKYNVTFYTITWGSLIFALRDGHHQPWEKDVDIDYVQPKENGRLAVRQFINDFNMSTNPGFHWIVDTGTFFRRYHEKYGYPNPNQYYCFINHEYVHYEQSRPVEQSSRNCLFLCGGIIFLDVHFNDIENDVDAIYQQTQLSFENIEFLDKYMIGPLTYNGSNNMMPPKALYVYPTFHRCLDYKYQHLIAGVWHDWPRFILNDMDQINYLGLNPNHMFAKNNTYWHMTKQRITRFFNGDESWLNYTKFKNWLENKEKNHTGRGKFRVCPGYFKK